MTAPTGFHPASKGPFDGVSQHPLTLCFDEPDVETKFRATYAEKTVRQVRWVSGLTAVVLLLFVAFAPWFFAHAPDVVVPLRIGVSVVAVSALVALGALPANSESEFPSTHVQDLAREIFGATNKGSSVSREPQSHVNAKGGTGIFLPFGLESLLPRVVDGLLEPDVKVAEAKSPLRVTHRRLDNREVYFVINDSGEPWAGQAEFAAAGGIPE